MSEHEDGYQGRATLLMGGTQAGGEVEVEVTLRGQFQPIDGRYHWYGRIAADEHLDALAGGRKTAVRIRTSEGEAAGDVSDPDTWGRYRIMGTSTPPFATDTTPRSQGPPEGTACGRAVSRTGPAAA